MKSYKEFIKESKMDIDSICEKYGIRNYTINSDGSIDVNGNVDLSHNWSSSRLKTSKSNDKLTKLPLSFRNVTGHFSCENNELTSLQGSPQIVGGEFACFNNKLTSLEGGPKNVGGLFDCRINKLTSLEGCPEIIGSDFYCNVNGLMDFKGVSEFFERGFYCYKNPIYEIYDLFNTTKCIKWINEWDVIQGDQVILDRLEEVFHQLNMEIPKNIEFENYKVV